MGVCVCVCVVRRQYWTDIGRICSKLFWCLVRECLGVSVPASLSARVLECLGVRLACCMGVCVPVRVEPEGMNRQECRPQKHTWLEIVIDHGVVRVVR